MSLLAKRRSRALRAARTAGAEAMLVTHAPDLRYLSGFTGSSGALVLGKGRPRFFTDGRYREQAAAELEGIAIVVEQRGASAAAVAWLAEQPLTSCAFDAAHTTVAALDSMRALLPPPRRRKFFVATLDLVATLREQKDAGEIEQMRRAAALGCDLFDGILEHIHPGVAETDIALRLETAARKAGAEGMSFDTIVASGPRSALPHGRASQARLPRRGFVTLDFGVVLDGYCSDMTRTVHLGRPESEARTVYDSVLEAQLAGVAAIHSGAVTGDVDEAARAVLRRSSLDTWFTHSTGHGVGLEIHEGPRLAARQTQRLKAGMVVTVEPGVYLPNRFGVRIEDTVLVTKTGVSILTTSTKALIEL